jgi:hypothetical protein
VWQPEDWELDKASPKRIKHKTCSNCGEFGWNRYWCPHCSCLICESAEHIAHDCPGRQDSKYADRLGGNQEAGQERHLSGQNRQPSGQNRHPSGQNRHPSGQRQRTNAAADWRARQLSNCSLAVSIRAPGPRHEISANPLPFKDWPVRFKPKA